jgi:hypothetical protein
MDDPYMVTTTGLASLTTNHLAKERIGEQL